MIRVSGLTKRYGARTAVDDVSFEVGKGEIVGFLGPNGAGKSTTLRILAGFVGATAGVVTIDGHDVGVDSFEARRCIGYMPEAVPLYPEMRVVEYLSFRAELKRVARDVRRRRVEEAMTKAAIIDVAHRTIGHLSKGYRQRVGLADAIVGRPPIVILDEPTAGLDPNQIREVRQLVRDLGREHTVLVSTHILSEVEACATRVLLMHRGKIVLQGPTDDIRALRGAPSASIVVRGDEAAAVRLVAGVAGVERVTSANAANGANGASGANVARLRVAFTAGASSDDRAVALERCIAALVAGGIAVREARPSGGSLEEVFSSLTRHAEEPAPEASA